MALVIAAFYPSHHDLTIFRVRWGVQDAVSLTRELVRCLIGAMGHGPPGSCPSFSGLDVFPD
jgi:hypothetical protein